jgi:hypothetical protein
VESALESELELGVEPEVESELEPGGELATALIPRPPLVFKKFPI